jgi:excisionase family DNA binding protein
MPKDLSAIESCRRLGITLDALYRLIYAGRLLARKEGRVWHIPAASVEARLKARQKKAQGQPEQAP